MIFVSEKLGGEQDMELKPIYYGHYFYFASALRVMLNRDFTWHVLVAENKVFANLI